MENKMLFASIYIDKGMAVKRSEDNDYVEISTALKAAEQYANNGADGLFLFDLSDNDEDHEIFIGCVKEIVRAIEIPVIAGGAVKRLEDIKKILYAGAIKALLDGRKKEHIALAKEGAARFGKEKIALSIEDLKVFREIQENLLEHMSTLVTFGLKEEELDSFNLEFPAISMAEKGNRTSFLSLLKKQQISGIGIDEEESQNFDFIDLKYECKDLGISMNVFESAISFQEFKLNENGLIPVIVQDYKTDQVLMLAYMNEDSFEHTIKSGKMTYYSRSRKERWIKGETSGHYQYVKGLFLDCDNDTILAKVAQVGAACHTGSTSCFYQPLIEKESARTNPHKVFEDVYRVILDRKEHPKEGSYTNYLFDKGVDKILKKLGEEATEIVIAAKNPDSEEIKYEISDFLYHMMVLMAEKNVDWEDITRELANR